MQRQKKQKFDISSVVGWFDAYKDLMTTYLRYLLDTDATESIIVEALLQTARRTASSKVHSDALTTALLVCRQLARHRYRRTKQRTIVISEQAPTSESLDSTSLHSTSFLQQPFQSEAKQWIRTVLDLPRQHREVFVLREIIGLSSIRTSRVVKLPSVRVEARLHQAVERIDSVLQTSASRNALEKLLQDDFASTESILDATLRSKLQFEFEGVETSEESLETRVRQWQQRRRRRRMVVGTSIPAFVVVLGGVAAWFYQPWIYWMQPIQPAVSNQDVKSTYLQTVGFIPRIPTKLPALFSKDYTMWQQNETGPNHPHPYYFGIILTQKSQSGGSPQVPIQIIEDKQVQDNFNYIGQNGTHLPDVVMNGVHVSMTKSPNMLTAKYQTNGVYTTIMAQWGQQQTGIPKQDVIALIRSMLIHPKRVSATPDYQVSQLSSLSEVKAQIDFKPVLLQAGLLKKPLTTSPQVHGTLIRHGKQSYETVQILYSETPSNSSTQASTSNGSTNQASGQVLSGQLQLNISEMRGSITLPQGQTQSALPKQRPSGQSEVVDGEQVISEGTNALFWYDKRTKVAFHVNMTGTAQDISQNKNLVKNAMTALIQQTR